jgi:enoyl-CoA hydratase/carnithine racemase
MDVAASVRPAAVAPGLRCLVLHLGRAHAGWTDDAVLALADLAVPVVAVAHGAADGLAAAGLLLADLRVASRSSVLHVPPLVGGTTATLPALVGVAAAQRLLLVPEPVDADAALALGLVHVVTDDAEHEAARLAAAVAREPGAGAAARRALRTVSGRAALADVLAEEHRLRQVARMHRREA